MAVVAVMMAGTVQATSDYVYDYSTPHPYVVPDGTHPEEFHFNEDPHSVPNPLAFKPYMTSTMVKTLKDMSEDDNLIAGQTELENIPSLPDPQFFEPYNTKAKAPTDKDLWMTKNWGKETLDV